MMRICLFVLGLGVLCGGLFAAPARADLGPPVHLQITEREPGLFRVQWRVPTVLPPRAVPLPELPESCALSSEPTVTSLAGAWLFSSELRCDESLAGQVLGMRYPFPELALTTVMRVELLSGDRFAHVWSPGESPWRLPQGTAAPDPLETVRRALLAGVLHVLRSWIHFLFLIVLVALGGSRSMLALVSAFTLGQIVGGLGSELLPGLGATPAEITFAAAVVVLARQIFIPPPERRHLAWLCGLAGLLHGLGIASWLASSLGTESPGLVSRLVVVLGMDATHLSAGWLLSALGSLLMRRKPTGGLRRTMIYGVGGWSMALAIGLAVQDSSGGSSDIAPTLMTPSSTGSTATPGSQRVAPTAPDAALQSYLVVEPFELRHEVLVRLRGVGKEFGLAPEAMIAVEEQAPLAEALAEWLLAKTQLRSDGLVVEGSLRRVDFLSVDATGALPRSTPQEETVAEAVLGAVIVYPVEGIPREVELRWDEFPRDISLIPSTIIDPENVLAGALSPEAPRVVWEYALLEDPLPSVEAVEVEPLRIPIPWLSIPLVLLALALVFRSARTAHASTQLAIARILLALAVLVGPLAESAISFTGASTRVPSERQARRILAGLIPNVYRAIEFREEALVYDRLAISVTGESLAEVYLQQRNALELEERGGAQARVESVEILEASEIEGAENGFEVSSVWTVGGMVTHFGHRHFRQNRYRARLEIVASADTWKIRSMEVLEQDRLK